MSRNLLFLILTLITITALSLICYPQIREKIESHGYESYNERNSTQRELLKIAQLAVDTDVELEMFDENRVKSANDPQIAEAMKNRFEGSKRVFRSITEQHLPPAIKYSNTFSNLKYKINGDSAILTARVNEEKVYPGNDQSPNNDQISSGAYTAAGWIEHKFEFNFRDGAWILTNDLRVNDDSENPNLQQSDGENNWDIFSEPGTKSISKDMLFNFTESGQSVASDTISRTEILRYAYSYFQQGNSNYRTFDNDCTNFTSQCLFAGGSSMAGGLRESVSSWYYSGPPYSYPPFTSLQSLTWNKAENFRDFAFLRSDRFTRVEPRELVPADILQVKWNAPNDPGYHSMTITRISPNGDPLFTQHSYNFANHSFAELAGRYPNAIWYGWHLNIPGEINITSIIPNQLRISQGQGNGIWMTVTGNNLRQGVTASVDQWQIANSGVRWINQNTVQVWVAMNNNRGTYTLQLKNPDGSVARKNFSVIP